MTVAQIVDEVNRWARVRVEFQSRESCEVNGNGVFYGRAR